MDESNTNTGPQAFSNDTNSDEDDVTESTDVFFDADDDVNIVYQDVHDKIQIQYEEFGSNYDVAESEPGTNSSGFGDFVDANNTEIVDNLPESLPMNFMIAHETIDTDPFSLVASHTSQTPDIGALSGFEQTTEMSEKSDASSGFSDFVDVKAEVDETLAPSMFSDIDLSRQVMEDQKVQIENSMTLRPSRTDMEAFIGEKANDISDPFGDIPSSYCDDFIPDTIDMKAIEINQGDTNMKEENDIPPEPDSTQTHDLVSLEHFGATSEAMDIGNLSTNVTSDPFGDIPSSSCDDFIPDTIDMKAIEINQGDTIMKDENDIPSEPDSTQPPDLVSLEHFLTTSDAIDVGILSTKSHDSVQNNIDSDPEQTLSGFSTPGTVTDTYSAERESLGDVEFNVVDSPDTVECNDDAISESNSPQSTSIPVSTEDNEPTDFCATTNTPIDPGFHYNHALVSEPDTLNENTEGIYEDKVTAQIDVEVTPIEIDTKTSDFMISEESLETTPTLKDINSYSTNQTQLDAQFTVNPNNFSDDKDTIADLTSSDEKKLMSIEPTEVQSDLLGDFEQEFKSNDTCTNVVEDDEFGDFDGTPTGEEKIINTDNVGDIIVDKTSSDEKNISGNFTSVESAEVQSDNLYSSDQEFDSNDSCINFVEDDPFKFGDWTPTPTDIENNVNTDNENFIDDDDFGDFGEAPESLEEQPSNQEPSTGMDDDFGDFSSFPDEVPTSTPNAENYVDDPVIRMIRTELPSIFSMYGKYTSEELNVVDSVKTENTTIRSLLESLGSYDEKKAVQHDVKVVVSLLQNSPTQRQESSKIIIRDGGKGPFAHLLRPAGGYKPFSILKKEKKEIKLLHAPATEYFTSRTPNLERTLNVPHTIANVDVGKQQDDRLPEPVKSFLSRIPDLSYMLSTKLLLPASNQGTH